MPNVGLNWQNILEINTTPQAETPTWVQIRKGFNNITQAINEVVYQTSYMSDEGYGSSTVTGGQFTLTLTGDRQYDDAAQNYIFSDEVMYKWGEARETQLRITRANDIKIEWDVTMARIAEDGGEANSVTSVTVEFHSNGTPTIVVEDPEEQD